MANLEDLKSVNSFIDDCIKAQNIYRMKHHAPPLTRSETLCNSAREWAQQLLTMDLLTNSPDAAQGVIGENISRKRGPPASNVNCPDIGSQEVADQWYSEITKHDFRFGPPADTPPVAGSFTQMVWKSTNEVGMWKVRADGQCIVVAQYNPPGNVFGKYVENVDPIAAVDSEGTERRSNETMHYQGQDGSSFVLKRDTAEFVDHEGRYVRKVEEVRERVADGAANSISSEKRLSDETSLPALLAPEEYLKMDPLAIEALCGYTADELKAFKKKVLDEHNRFRRKHNNYPLKLSEELSGRAMKWAAHLCASGRLSNSNEVNRGSPLGESIASKWSDSSKDSDYTGTDLVEKWYSESKTYNYDAEPKSVEGIGNFTQVVWHSTRDLGVAKFKRKDKSGCRVVVVCYYYPAGNVLSYFRANVTRPRSLSQATLESKRTSISVQPVDASGAYETSQQLGSIMFPNEPMSFAKLASPAPVFSPDFGRRSAEANGTQPILGSPLEPRSPLIARNPAIGAAFKK